MGTIAQLRKERRMTQRQLALRLGVSVTAVASWEQGRYDPSARLLLRLADLFAVDPRTVVLPADAVSSAHGDDAKGTTEDGTEPRSPVGQSRP